MKYIGNILSEERLSVLPGGILYNITTEQEDLIPGLPTLIIGWKKTKEIYPNASIIEWQVEKNVYWTYGKYEKREKYEVNLQNFFNLCLKILFEDTEYLFFDVFHYGENRFSDFLTSLTDSGTEKFIYSIRDMLYIYYEGAKTTKKVYGVSLRDCDYLDPTYKKKIFSSIYNNDKITLIKNNDEFQDKLREIRNVIRGKEYIIPYLFSNN